MQKTCVFFAQNLLAIPPQSFDNGRFDSDAPRERALAQSTCSAWVLTVTEAELIKRCGQGDRAARQELFVRTSDRVYRLLLRMTRNPDMAFDLTQDTYCRAFDRIGQFDGRSSVSTWLYRIAVNEALQFLRKKTPQALHADKSSRRAMASGESTEAKHDVEDALAKLGPDDRVVLLLRYQEGLDYHQISEVMDCPPGTVASRLNRARHAIRGLLADGYDPGEETSSETHQRVGH